MKLLGIVLIALLLSSCALTSQYDNNEYELLARLETSVRLVSEHCSTPERVKTYIPDMIQDSELLTTYTFYIPKNTDVYQMSVILRDDIREFEAQYEKDAATTLYCKLKTKTFLTKVRTALDAVASKLE